ncbi:glycoside hydrolase family 31 protein [Shouchella miscanthi]|uniref:Glycoside hydrolase family 31 protein n=1 Tax=Shouchella miscanthi TaxID=2598861 RepID=A0ABU6NQY9_9BACI|nr:glycoside hydrolase family 31 protein [Shouchella miscanthi]
MNIQAPYQFELKEKKGSLLSFYSSEAQMTAYVFVLEQGIFRVLFEKEEGLEVPQTWSIAPGCDDVPVEGRPRFSTEGFTCPTFATKEYDRHIEIATNELKAVIQKEGFRMAWFQKQQGEWVEFASDRMTQAYNFKGELGKSLKHYLKRDISEHYFGLGERTGELNRHHGRFRNLTIDAMGYDAQYSDPLYKHIPFYITRNPKTSYSYGLFYDNLAPGYIDLGRELDNYHSLYRYFEAEAGDLDYYMIGGPTVRDVVQTYTWLTGNTMMPPKWSIGYSGSTMSYTDASNAQEQLYQFIADCEEHDILCDSFQLSSGYTSIGDKRYVFHWNKEKFPDAKKLAADFREKGLRLAANIKPAFLAGHPAYEELEENDYFITDGQGKTELAQFWDGGGAYLDFTNKHAFNWWKTQVTNQLLEYGISSTWNDNNEYEIWNEHAQVNGFDHALPFQTIRGLFPLLMMKASFEAQEAFTKEERPFLISRSGGPGMQRYVQTWTGDNRTEWKTIRFNTKTGLGLSLSGIYNYGHDVGGFAGPKPDQELFIRWVQNGIFHPRFTIHSWNEDQTVNEPWMYPEATPAIRALIQLRSMLTPYWYTTFYEARTRHEPIMKPTFFDFEADAKTWEENDDFLAGPAFLVASVVEPGVDERRVYAPKSKGGWFDFYRGTAVAGGTEVTLPAPDHETPLLVKAGSMIPVNGAERTFKKKDEDVRGFLLFPEEGANHRSSYTLYEDDGISRDWKENHALVHLDMTTTADTISITVTVDHHGYVLPYKEAIFTIATGDRRTLIVNGKTIESGQRGVIC